MTAVAVLSTGLLAVAGVALWRVSSMLQSARLDRFEMSAQAHDCEAALGRVGEDIARLCEDSRYEVMIADWSEDEGEHWVGNEMRYRWVVFDANRYLYPMAAPNPLEADPETQERVLDPLTLGNAPTRAEAEVQAMAWIAKQSPEAAVVAS